MTIAAMKSVNGWLLSERRRDKEHAATAQLDQSPSPICMYAPSFETGALRPPQHEVHYSPHPEEAARPSRRM